MEIDTLLDCDGCYILLGKVVKRAIKDARRGDREAAKFLEVVAPDIAEKELRRRNLTKPNISRVNC